MPNRGKPYGHGLPFGARAQIIDTLEATSEGKSREDLADEVRREIAKNGGTPSPLFVSALVDRIETKRAARSLTRRERLRRAWRSLGTGRSILRELGQARIPGWMAPPEGHYGRGVPHTFRVVLDDDANSYVKRMFQELSGRQGRTDPKLTMGVVCTDESAESLEVHTSKRKIGRLVGPYPEPLMQAVRQQRPGALLGQATLRSDSSIVVTLGL